MIYFALRTELRHGAASWAPLACLDAVAVGSLNFKSQRANRPRNYWRLDQGRRCRSADPLPPPFFTPTTREGPFEFSPLYFSLHPHLSRSRVGLFLLFADTVSKASTVRPLPPRLCKIIIVECGQLFPDARWRHARAFSPGHVRRRLLRK